MKKIISIFLILSIFLMSGCKENKENNYYTNNKYIVYWGDTGTKIHIDPDCPSLGAKPNSGTLHKAEQIRKGGWCKICSKEWNEERFIKEGNPYAK